MEAYAIDANGWQSTSQSTDPLFGLCMGAFLLGARGPQLLFRLWIAVPC